MENCSKCWWKEGDRCYLEPFKSLKDGRSLKIARERCCHYKTKRSVLGKLIPTEKLIIFSKHNNVKKGL